MVRIQVHWSSDIISCYDDRKMWYLIPSSFSTIGDVAQDLLVTHEISTEYILPLRLTLQDAILPLLSSIALIQENDCITVSYEKRSRKKNKKRKKERVRVLEEAVVEESVLEEEEESVVEELLEEEEEVLEEEEEEVIVETPLPKEKEETKRRKRRRQRTRKRSVKKRKRSLSVELVKENTSDVEVVIPGKASVIEQSPVIELQVSVIEQASSIIPKRQVMTVQHGKKKGHVRFEGQEQEVVVVDQEEEEEEETSQDLNCGLEQYEGRKIKAELINYSKNHRPIINHYHEEPHMGKYGPISNVNTMYDEEEEEVFNEDENAEQTTLRAWNVPRGGYEWKRPYSIIASLLLQDGDEPEGETSPTPEWQLQVDRMKIHDASVDFEPLPILIAYRTMSLCEETWTPLESDWQVGKVVEQTSSCFTIEIHRDTERRIDADTTFAWRTTNERHEVERTSFSMMKIVDLEAWRVSVEET